MGLSTPSGTTDEVAELLRALSARDAEIADLRSAFGEFASAAGHELKSPLNKIAAFARLLEEGGSGLTKDSREDLGFLLLSVNVLRHRVDQLLDYARAGRVALELEDVQVDSCVDLALRFVGDGLEAGGVEVERDELPVVRADLAWLGVAFKHLLENVTQHSGGSTLRCRITAETRDGELVFGVRDWGLGIAEQHRERIFAPFERAHGSGAGLGLAVAARVVERHGGRLWLESPTDGGAHFLFSLP